MTAQLNLTSCDSEPIHLLSAIQPVGFLLSLSADWIVLRASDNATITLGLTHDIIGHPARNFLSADLIHEIRGRLQIAAGTGIVERLFDCEIKASSPRYDISVHVSGIEIVLEFEKAIGHVRTPLSILRSMMARVERQSSSQAMYNEAARQVRALTGFDRVMVYRFDENGDGDVVAEAAAGQLSPFIGLRYPASDIPSQARALYKRNFLRIIVDIDAPAVAVRPTLSPEGTQLDLSMSGLRSVSPVHLEYLRNMDVKASMSISIIVAGQLWGLIACHHSKPLHLGLEIRSTAELFGQMFSYLLETRQHLEDEAHDNLTREIHNGVAVAFATSDTLVKSIPDFFASVANYVIADGIGIYHSGQINLTGITPTHDEFVQLVRFLNTTASGKVFSTFHLGDVFPVAANYSTRVAGILSIPISRVPRDFLIFFRKEIEKTVTWAGEPVKTLNVGPYGVRLTPRKSFDAWKESVRGQSAPWSKGELRAAEKLRITLLEIIVRETESAQASRTISQQSQELLVAELNHRVRNILGLVRGLISQSAVSAVDVRALVETLDHRIRSLARAQDLLTSSDWTPTPLRLLLIAEIETYGAIQDRLTLTGPEVILQPTAFTPMALVVHELVTNARKYGALSTPTGQISVVTAEDALGNVSIMWSETGGPIVTAPSRKGFGSTVLTQVIPFELKGTSSARYPASGYCLDMTIPTAYAKCIQTAQCLPLISGENIAVLPADIERLLTHCLLVEDNLFIAIDAEDLLRTLGAKTVLIANSVADALTMIATHQFSFALLDVNLGPENSLAIALRAKTQTIPFVFGTGYGEDLAMGDALANIPIVTKPYHRQSMLKAMSRLISEKTTDGMLT